MATSAGRKTVGVSRGLMMRCDICYAQVIADKLTDEKNFVIDADTLFDTICCGCTDINRLLIDDMAGSAESRPLLISHFWMPGFSCRN